MSVRALSSVRWQELLVSSLSANYDGNTQGTCRMFGSSASRQSDPSGLFRAIQPILCSCLCPYCLKHVRSILTRYQAVSSCDYTLYSLPRILRKLNFQDLLTDVFFSFRIAFQRDFRLHKYCFRENVAERGFSN